MTESWSKAYTENLPLFHCPWVSCLHGPSLIFHPNGQNNQGKYWSHLQDEQQAGTQQRMPSSNLLAILEQHQKTGVSQMATRFLLRPTVMALLRLHTTPQGSHLTLFQTSYAAAELSLAFSGKLWAFLKGLMLKSQLFTNGSSLKLNAW